MILLSLIKQKWESMGQSWRFAITIFLLARIFYAVWSWTILTIQPVAIHYLDAGGEPAAIFLNLHTIRPYTYLREVNGVILTFRATSKDTVSDLQTNSLWDVRTGTALEGVFKGHTLSPTSLPPYLFPYFDVKPYPHPWLGLWQRFDAIWYISIAEFGYGAIAGDHAFPPIFPLLITFLKPVFGNAFLAGLFISHLSTLYALKMMYDTFVQWGGHAFTQKALVLFLLFPTSFFLFSVYSEPLFLVFALLSIRSMTNHSWPWAGFWTFLAILTRLQGIALLFCLLFLMWKHYIFPNRLQLWAGSITAGAGFLFYLYLRAGIIQGNSASFTDPAWHARFVPPWEAFWIAVQNIFSGTSNFIDLLNWITTITFMLLVIAGWRKIPLEYNLYAGFSLLVMLTRAVEGQPLIAMTRYALTLFPCFFTLGRIENPWVQRIVLYSCFALNLFLSAEFFSWAYVA